MKRHLLSAADLDPRRRRPASSTPPRRWPASPTGAIKKLPTLRGRTVVNLFFEDSTRTRISFEAAAKRLSADVINFSAKGSSVSKGECLKDTALTLQAMGADAVVIRHGASGAPHRLATARLDRRRASSTPATAPTSTRPRRCSTRSRCAAACTAGDAAGRDLDGRAGHDRRRRPALPGRPLERAAAAHPRRRGHPGRAADPAAGRRRGLAVRRSSYDLDAALAEVRRGDDAAGPARADERRVLPDRARVLPPLRPRRATGWRGCPSTRSSCTPAR